MALLPAVMDGGSAMSAFQIACSRMHSWSLGRVEKPRGYEARVGRRVGRRRLEVAKQITLHETASTIGT